MKEGTTVRIIGNHPHQGELGTLTREKARGLMGNRPMYKILLSDCAHGMDGCFAEEINMEETCVLERCAWCKDCFAGTLVDHFCGKCLRCRSDCVCLAQPL